MTTNQDPQVLRAILTALQALAPTQMNPTTFALTPGHHKADDVINSTKGGKALYEEGGSALKSTFNLGASQLVIFVQESTFWAKETGWSEGNQNITKFDITSSGVTTTFNILSQCGQIPEPDLKIIFAKWAENDTHNSTRGTQNNAMMVKCLQASLTNPMLYQLYPTFHPSLSTQL